jgi:hypothetical protein
MKNLLLITLLFISFNGFSQSFSQCITNKDSFTGKEATGYVIKIGGLINIGNNLSFTKDGDKKSIIYSWLIQSPGDNDTKVEKTSLLIRFDDGEVIKFLPSADSKITNSNGYVAYIFVSDLNQENIEKLKSKNVDGIRFGFIDDRGIDVNMTKKNFKDIKEGVTCVSN